MNPCPCGHAGTSRCTCRPDQVEMYRQRLSGPLRDRIDLHVEVPAVRYEQLRVANSGERSATIRARVEAARSIQRARLAGTGLHDNAQMGPTELRAYCTLDDAGHELAGDECIETRHLAEAVGYRANMGWLKATPRFLLVAAI